MSARTFSTRPRPDPITEPDEVPKVVGGITVTVSAVDADLFEDYTYYVGKTGYVCVSFNGLLTILHRQVMERMGIDVPEGQVVDHRDQNKANNVRSNLRVTTKSVNAMNASNCWKENTSGFRGVTLEPVRGQFLAVAGGRNMGQDPDPRIAKTYRVEGVRRFVGEEAADLETDPECEDEGWETARAKVAALPDQRPIRRLGEINERPSYMGTRYRARLKGLCLGTHSSPVLAQASIERQAAMEEQVEWEKHEEQYTANGELCLRTKKGEEVLVDADIYRLYYNKNVYVNKSTGYARVGTNVQLHGLVQPIPPGFDVVDHRNGNKLDNRRENLRPATWALNIRNRYPYDTE